MNNPLHYPWVELRQHSHAPTLAGHFRIMRLDHWIKNVFVLPGIVIAIAFTQVPLTTQVALNIVLGILAVGLVTSSNYVLNEILDSPYDRWHPSKKSRPVPGGQVNIPVGGLQWMALFAAGALLARAVNVQLFYLLTLLWIMGCIYNVPPLRSKEWPYLDVISEAVNNPIRLMAGWYMVDGATWPPGSLLAAYWMVGCYFMAIKRFSELVNLSDDERASMGKYRTSFQYYTPTRLLISIVFYGSASMLFLGVFIMRYRMELILSFPLIALVMAQYLNIGFKPDSSAQNPEKLYKEFGLMVTLAACSILIVCLFFMDIPWIHDFFAPSFPYMAN
ncbi:MAG: UbiA family prenyltransferase [Deltaproteobacteria bacterium]|nr:UbiA family prenyltransferase [bacterium]MCB9489682.1 UbiA family prenyltransferase [Deltaproteobacteria bacterium]